MAVFTVPVEVRFNDIDGMGHVNNALYLTFLEQARMKFFTEQAGATSEKDFPFILAHAALDYKFPMTMDAQPEVRMWTSRIGGKSWDFDYEIRGGRTGRIYATGKTVQVAYDYQLDKSDRLEGDLRKLVKALEP
ncbi:MAG: acyl-CoA thioesterase [Thermoplasmatota archaeon]